MVITRFTLIFFLLASLWATAGETLFQKDGRPIQGELLGCTETHIRLQTRPGVVISIPASKLSPESFYRARLKWIDREDGAQRYRLGLYLLQHNLFAAARRELTEAVRLTPTLKTSVSEKLTELADRQDKHHLDLARKEIQKKQWSQAIQRLKRFLSRTPLPARAPEAQNLLELANDSREKNRHLKSPEASDLSRKKEKFDRQKRKIDALYKECLRLRKWADQEVSKGFTLAAKGQLTAPDRCMGRALDAYRKAQNYLAQIERATGDASLITQSQELQKEIIRKRADILAHRGYLHLESKSFTNARKYGLEALALQPNHPRAQQLLERLKQAGFLMRKASDMNPASGPVIQNR
ncbi:MAG: hypothetical protein QF752_10620 [Planctomycetota bacterium]|jgi:hypothetical protein|nr:hypothetical protein [Planctomycetota bacterium]